MCLAIARTVILERSPVTMVARAMDVLVTSYSHSVKTGSYLKGIKSEKTSPSSVPHVSSPRSGADVSASRVDALEKSVKHASTAGVDNEYASDSEENPSSEPSKTNLSDLQIFDGKVDNEKLMRAETSSTEVQPTSLQHHLLEPGNNPLNANGSEQQEAQLTSPAISPEEMYSFVFAPVEEEIVGDPSYLVAIIVEFLHRYAVFNELKSDSGY